MCLINGKTAEDVMRQLIQELKESAQERRESAKYMAGNMQFVSASRRQIQAETFDAIVQKLNDMRIEIAPPPSAEPCEKPQREGSTSEETKAEVWKVAQHPNHIEIFSNQHDEHVTLAILPGTSKTQRQHARIMAAAVSMLDILRRIIPLFEKWVIGLYAFQYVREIKTQADRILANIDRDDQSTSTFHPPSTK